MPILLALVKKAQDRRHCAWLEALQDSASSDVLDDLEFHARMAQLACSVYGASWAKDRADQAREMGLADESQILLTNFADIDEHHCPMFMLLVDEQSKNIVLAIRGTFSAADVLADVICDEEAFLDGHAHRGIVQGADRVLQKAEKMMTEACSARPDFG